MGSATDAGKRERKCSLRLLFRVGRIRNNRAKVRSLSDLGLLIRHKFRRQVLPEKQYSRTPLDRPKQENSGNKMHLNTHPSSFKNYCRRLGKMIVVIRHDDDDDDSTSDSSTSRTVARHKKTSSHRKQRHGKSAQTTSVKNSGKSARRKCVHFNLDVNEMIETMAQTEALHDDCTPSLWYSQEELNDMRQQALDDAGAFIVHHKNAAQCQRILGRVYQESSQAICEKRFDEIPHLRHNLSRFVYRGDTGATVLGLERFLVGPNLLEDRKHRKQSIWEELLLANDKSNSSSCTIRDLVRQKSLPSQIFVREVALALASSLVQEEIESN